MKEWSNCKKVDEKEGEEEKSLDLIKRVGEQIAEEAKEGKK